MRQVPLNTIITTALKPHRITLLTSIGAGLEYYAYVIYSLLASFISQQFFPSSSRYASLFMTFGVLTLGNIIRPIGGMIFGLIGDRYGRKKTFANTILIMAIATFIMGILPSYARWGLASPIIFSCCLILQGIAFGAELPGALTFLLEHIHEKKRGRHCGFMIASVGLGVSFGSFIIYLLNRYLSAEQMASWGFRLPFIFGGFVALLGFLIRRYTSETPAFQALRNPKRTMIWQELKAAPLHLIKSIGLILFPATMVIFYLVLPTYLHDVYHYQFATIYLAIAIGHFWCTLLLPIFGWWSDYIGRKLLFSVALCSAIFGLFLLFWLLQLQSTWALFAFVILCQTLIAAMAASYFVLLPEAFPTSIRYTGTALSYNLAYTLAAAIPLISNHIFEGLHRPVLMVVLFMGLASVTLLSNLTLQKSVSVNLEFGE
jgi:MFS family permease